ncbi:MAG: YceI family protein [Actinobacteria bacterium]|nr:YceI family protein [Actinomycetota bacterium]
MPIDSSSPPRTQTLAPDPPKSPKRPHYLRWILGAVALALLLFVGGPYAYLNLFSSEAPAPLSLSATPSSVASASSAASASSGGAAQGQAATNTSINGTWTIASGSQAGYRVKETLFGQSTEAVGRTSGVIGSVTIADQKVTKADVTVDMKSVTSDKSQRDGQFQSRIMQTSTFPTATFSLTKPIDLSTVPADGTTTNFTATGKLTVHGVTKTVDIPLQAKRDGNTIALSGSYNITFADFDIDNPSGGPAQVGDTGTLELLVNLSR